MLQIINSNKFCTRLIIILSLILNFYISANKFVNKSLEVVNKSQEKTPYIVIDIIEYN